MNKSSTNFNFISIENTEILWEVIQDDDVFSSINPEQMKTYFNNQLRHFFDREKMSPSSSDLFQLNKIFISNFITNIQQQQLQQQQLQQQQLPAVELPKKINISNNITASGLITVEELHADRRSMFDNELAIKRNEFNSAMALPIPEVPNFTDKKDVPISEMEKLVAETLAQRNFEIQQIHSQTLVSSEATKWLKGEITSIKAETAQQNSINVETEENLKYKFIQIGDKIESTSSLKKNISWATEITTHIEPDNNIQLRIVEDNTDNNTDSNNNIFSRLKYVEKARENELPLPLPLSLSSLNTKIDNLTEKMERIEQLLQLIYSTKTIQDSTHF